MPSTRQPALPESLVLAYHQLQRAGRHGTWRALLGTLLVLVGTLALAPVVLQAAYAVWLAATGRPIGPGLTSLLDLDDPSPASLAYLNLVLAAAIPLVFLASWLLHGIRPRWLSSVAGGLRWRWFVVCLGLSVVALVATVVVTALLPQQGTGTDVGGEVRAFTDTTRDFLLVVLLLTPLQAAGEEYAFRGYFTQLVGGLVPARVLAVVVPALLFALAHGLAQSWPIFFDRFAFGLVAGVLVIRTGGLEAGIAMHVLNNFLAFGLALAFSDMGSALSPTGGSWWSIPGTLVQSLVYLALASCAARRIGLATTADPAAVAGGAGPELVGPTPRV